MYVIENDKFCVVPLAYNEFCKDIASLASTERYAGGVAVDRIIDRDSIAEVVSFVQGEPDMLYILDMQHIIAYGNRALSLLLDIPKGKVIIVNIDDELVEGIKEDLESKYVLVGENVLCSDGSLVSTYMQLKVEIGRIYQKVLSDIVLELSEKFTKRDIKDLKPLDSSGVYCNMYVNIKRLFADPDRYSFVIYHLVKLVRDCNIQADALVSASRNGANIASNLGWLLDMKVVHCASLGPKFSLISGPVEKEIRKQKKYLYIFDFLCLGTELKLLNAMLSMAGAKLVAGIGIASYRDLEEMERLSVQSKLLSLVDIQKEKFGYCIAGTKEEIKTMLMKEDGKRNVAGLQRV